MRWRVLLWLLLSILAITLLRVQPSFWQQLSFLAQDVMIRQLASPAPVDDVVVVDIDESSLAMMGAWPWSRSLMGALVDKVANEYDAAVVGLDVVFPEQSNDKADAVLVQTVADTHTVLSIVWDYQGQEPALRVGNAGVGIAGQMLSSIPRAKGYLGNFPALAATGQVGHISPIPDANGTIRFAAPLVMWQDKAYPMLALTMMAQATHKTLHPVMRNGCLYPFVGQSLSLCLNDDGLWSLPYRHALSAFTVVPAWQLLMAQAPADILCHRYVIIGSSALGLSDRVVTPLAAVTPGMMVHAQMLASLLAPAQTQVIAGPNMMAWLLLSSLLLSWVLMRWGIRMGLVVVLASSLSWLWWVALDYQRGQVLPDIAFPMVVMLLWLGTQSALEWSLVKRQSQRIYRLFQDYLPPHLLKQALAKPDTRMLLPQQRHVTVLFADIAGFTTMTESLPTAEAAELTRHILSLLTQAVYTHDGTLDKYMGDALMAFWNAPLDQPNHAQRAAQSALAMRETIQQLNESRAAVGLAPIHVRIGINSGEVLVGDLGTQWRHAYTVLGDAVNVAQRLMVAAGQLGVDIAIGEAATDGVSDITLVGDMHLPGRARLERVFVLPVTINPHLQDIDTL